MSARMRRPRSDENNNPQDKPTSILRQNPRISIRIQPNPGDEDETSKWHCGPRGEVQEGHDAGAHAKTVRPTYGASGRSGGATGRGFGVGQLKRSSRRASELCATAPQETPSRFVRVCVLSRVVRRAGFKTCRSGCLRRVPPPGFVWM
eukprot:scaffold143_cov260-Pinguiococcus_pyrenoidosus.AAC.12